MVCKQSVYSATLDVMSGEPIQKQSRAESLLNWPPDDQVYDGDYEPTMHRPVDCNREESPQAHFGRGVGGFGHQPTRSDKDQKSDSPRGERAYSDPVASASS